MGLGKVKRRYLPLLKSYKFIFILIVLFSFGLRLWFLNDGLFHFDDVTTAKAVEKTYETGSLQPTVMGRYAFVAANLLFYIPYHLITGNNAEHIPAFTSAFFGALSILMLMLFSKKLFNNNLIAYSSGILLLFSPVFLSITTYGKEHSLALFLILSSFYLLWLYQEKRKISLLAFSSIVMGLSVCARESSLVFLPFYGLLYLYPGNNFKIKKLSRRKRAKKKIYLQLFKKYAQEKLNIKALLAAFLLLLVILLLAYLLYLQPVVYNALYNRGTGVVRFLGGFSYMLPTAFFDLIFSLTWVGYIFYFFGIFLSFLVFKKKKFEIVFLLLWSALFFYFGNTSGYASRFLVEILPPFIIFISISLFVLFNKNKFIVVALFLFIVIFNFINIYPIISFRSDYDGPKELALFIKEKTPENALIIAMDDMPFINYYAKRKTLSHPLGGQSEVEAWMYLVRDYLINGTPLYIIERERDGKKFISEYEGSAYNGKLHKIMSNNFKFTLISSMQSENFHKAMIKFNFYEASLVKLSLKAPKNTCATQPS